MRILFMGTPEIAAECLRALLDAGMDVRAVFTQPDKPQGRKMRLTPPPVKTLALERGVEVFQPTRLKKCGDLLRSIDPELIVVAAYGRILPKEVLDYPRYGAVNMHASLLPRWRGAAPIQRAIEAGDTLGGVTTMYMAEGLDTGDVIFREETPISPDDTGGTLRDRYAKIGGELLIKTIRAIEDGTAPRAPQPEEGAVYAAQITREDCRVDFARPAREVRDLIRAMNPDPGAFTIYSGAPMKLYAASLGHNEGEPGTVVSTRDGIEVACAEGSVVLTDIAAAGGKRMSAKAWLNGHRIEPGTKLGE